MEITGRTILQDSLTRLLALADQDQVASLALVAVIRTATSRQPMLMRLHTDNETTLIDVDRTIAGLEQLKRWILEWQFDNYSSSAEPDDESEDDECPDQPTPQN